MNEKIGTDGELSVQVVNADIENGNFDIIVTEDYDYPLRGKKGSCLYEKAFSFEP